jgi:ribose transport system substrate-binding protein
MRRFSFLVIPLFMLAILFAGSLIIVFSIGFVSPPKSHSVIVVLKTMKSDIEFWVTARTGILTAAKEFGMNVEIVGPWDESDVEGQLQVMDQVLGKKPEAIILVASDFHALVPSVEAAAGQGITVLTLDSAVDSDIPLCFVATNNVEAGEKAGSVMADRLEPDKAVAIVGHVKGAATAIDRELGVRRGLAGRTVVGTYFCENFSDRAYLITKEIMEAYPDIGGIVALNEVSTMGVAGRYATKPEGACQSGRIRSFYRGNQADRGRDHRRHRCSKTLQHGLPRGEKDLRGLAGQASGTLHRHRIRAHHP